HVEAPAICKLARSLALLLARCVSPCLSSPLGLTDIRIQRGFGDTHQCTDLLHRDLFLLIELHRQLPFVRLERFRTPAEASSRTSHAQPRLGTLLNQLPFKLG